MLGMSEWAIVLATDMGSAAGATVQLLESQGITSHTCYHL